jgi:capsular polysaccharide biosynthesis protein
VLKMAGTGILIAAHGAALVNSMFLPQHAVVIEVRRPRALLRRWLAHIYVSPLLSPRPAAATVADLPVAVQEDDLLQPRGAHGAVVRRSGCAEPCDSA